ncbi:metal-sensitive transcriptional regulator [Cutibacterium equinum]
MTHSDDCCHVPELALAHRDTDTSESSEECGACGCQDHPQHGYLGHKEMHLRRLKRIEGQVRGLERMVDEEKYCIDILTQISAVTSALKSVSLELLAEHMSHCVVRAAQAGGQEAEDKITEANQAIARLVKA